MIIYENTKAGFIDDVLQKRLQGKLETSFKLRTGSIPADHRVWEAEYGDFAWDLRESSIDGDVPIAVEYHLSAAGRFRIDLLLAGRSDDRDRALIIEMKGWEEADATPYGETVETMLQGSRTMVKHPSAQALGYRDFLVHFNEDIERHAIDVQACAYLHRFRRRTAEPLESEQYKSLLDQAPLFMLEDRERLRRHLERLIPHRPKDNVFWIIETGKIRPSKRLAECVASMLRGNEEFRLLDAQSTAYNVIESHLLDAQRKEERKVFIVRGGPGTGKSVIAMRLLSTLYKRGVPSFFVAPNQAFRATLADHLSRSGRDSHRLAKMLLQSSYRFHDADWSKDRTHAVLIVDEAHRLKHGNVYQYKGENMVADMVRAAKVSVFFVDETQQVTWNDCGSVSEIRTQADQIGVAVMELPELLAQFRCNGSTGYLNWIDDVLQIRPTGNFENWGDGQYEFAVFDKPDDLYRELQRKNAENRARLIAGYAWDWPAAGRQRGSGHTHVSAGQLSLPWNFTGSNWATAEDGIGQVGCIHTCQGVEFDWIGVLIGDDLVYKDGKVMGVPGKRARTDKSLHGSKAALESARGDQIATAKVEARIQNIIRNTYKVLLTRGQKGCLVWCADIALREYLRERMKLASTISGEEDKPIRKAAEPDTPYIG